jgi:hypothetical protein
VVAYDIKISFALGRFRCSQFEDLFSNVLFNYQWLYAKMSACPLQAVLSDFEDACNFVSDKDAKYMLGINWDSLFCSKQSLF